MFKRKKYIRLDEIQGTPKTSELKRLLLESNRARGCTVELPWRSQRTGLRYSVTVCFEVGGNEPIWSLYQGEGAQSRMIWTQTFKDPDLLHDVISLSLPAEAPLDIFAATRVNDRDKDWNPNLDRSKHTYAKETGEIELLSMPLDTALPKKPESDAFYTLAPLEEEPGRVEQAARSEHREDAYSQADSDNHDQAPVALPAQTQEAPQPVPQAQAPQAAQAAYPVQPGYPPGYDPNQHGQPAYPPPGYAYPAYPVPYPPYQSYPYPPQDPALYPPGYPPPDPNAYPPGYPAPYPPADPQTQPSQPYTGHYPPGYPVQYPPGYNMPPSSPYPPYPPYLAQPQGTVSVPRVGKDSDLIAKRPNVLLGDFLVATGLIPESTLDAALQLQGMVRNGSLSTAQAAEAVRRAHNRGGEVEQFTPSTPQAEAGAAKIIAPPLGEILVEAGLIRLSILKAALNLQEVVRTGALSKEEAIEAFIQEHFGKAGKHGTGESAHDQNVLELFLKAKLIQQQDLDAAIAVKKKHGGEVSKILEAAGKFDKMTFESASTCQTLLEEKRLKVEQAIIALHYCQRSRVTFDEAIEELGWEKP